MKKIRVLIANSVGELGGAEQVVLSLAERLSAYNVGVSFALLRPGPLENIIKSRGIPVYVFPEDYRFRNLLSVWRCVRWLTRVIREERADILHSNLTAHFIGGMAAKRAKIAELWHLHDYPNKFDLVHVISRLMPTDYNIFTTESLKSGEPLLQRTKHRVIHPNCVDFKKLSQFPPDRSVRDRLGLGSSPFFLTVTRIQEHKGHAYLIESVEEVLSKHPEAKWVIVGRPSGKEQIKYFQTLLAQVAAKKLQSHVFFVGFVPDEDLVPLYREAVALVHPALSEGYGLVLLEAMACGLPVIAFAATGPVEIFGNEGGGLLVPLGDASALAQAQKRVLDEPDLGSHLQEQVDFILERCSTDRMVEETVSCYKELVSAS